MRTDFEFSVIVERLVTVFSDENLTADYSKNGAVWECFTKWYKGAMAPVSRPAFCETFGVDTVTRAEEVARAQLAEKEAEWQKTAYFRHSNAADVWKAAGCAAPAVGDFIWGYSSNLKGDHGSYQHELFLLLERAEESRPMVPRLICVDAVITVENIFSVNFEQLIADHNFGGGSCSEDIARENVKSWEYTPDEIKTFYTLGAAVVDASGRWCIIDPEGYDYVRTFYSVPNYSSVFAPEIESERERKRLELEAEKAEKEAEQRQRRAEYDTKCQKWAPFMAEISPYQEAQKTAWKAYLDSGCKRNTPEQKANKAASLKLLNAQKANILAMCRHAFPGVKFSITKNNGWGAAWCLSWQDGPTEAEFNAATDLDLFITYWDTFDGMTDYADTEEAEFKDFAFKYIGESKSIDINRRMSTATESALTAEIMAILPDGVVSGDYIREAAAPVAAAKLGISLKHYGYSYSYNDYSFSAFLNTLFESRSYYTAPTVEAVPHVEEKPVPVENAPTLSIIDYSEKALALVGDTRSIKDKLKALGGRFNPRLSCGAGWIFSKSKENELKSLVGA